jgi:hypothetical protein
MKKIIVFLGIIGIISSCDKIKDLVKATFNLKNESVTVSIPASGSVLTYSNSETFSLNLDSIIKAQNSQLGIGNIKNFTVNSINLTIENPDSLNNFGNLSSCVISFYSNVKTTPITIASLASNPDVNVSTLNIPVSPGVDLMEYTRNASLLTYSLSGSLRRATTKELKVKVKADFSVTAGL